MAKKSRKSESVVIKNINLERNGDDLGVKFCFAAFYGLEMEKRLGWSVEERYKAQSQMAAMVQSGRSKLFIAYNSDKMPLGMIITTRTENKKIKRLDVIFVFEPFRGKGLAKLMLEYVRGDCDIHSYSAPNAFDWHLKNGFRNLGFAQDDGTYEMFTGGYKPEYKFNYIMPMPTSEDMRAIESLTALERRFKN